MREKGAQKNFLLPPCPLPFEKKKSRIREVPAGMTQEILQTPVEEGRETSRAHITRAVQTYK